MDATRRFRQAGVLPSLDARERPELESRASKKIIIREFLSLEMTKRKKDIPLLEGQRSLVVFAASKACSCEDRARRASVI